MFRRVQLIGRGLPSKATLADASVRGGFVACGTLPDLGAHVHVIDGEGSDVVRIVAEVVRVTAPGRAAQPGFAVQWLHATAGLEDALRTFLVLVGVPSLAEIGHDDEGHPRFEFSDEVLSGMAPSVKPGVDESSTDDGDPARISSPPDVSIRARPHSQSSPETRKATLRAVGVRTQSGPTRRASGRRTGGDSPYDSGTRQPIRRLSTLRKKEAIRRASGAYRPSGERRTTHAITSKKLISERTPVEEETKTNEKEGRKKAASMRSRRESGSGFKRMDTRGESESSTSSDAAATPNENESGSARKNLEVASESARRLAAEIAARRSRRPLVTTGHSLSGMRRKIRQSGRSSRTSESSASKSVPAPAATERSEELVIVDIRGAVTDAVIKHLTTETLTMELKRDPPREVDDIIFELLTDDGVVGVTCQRRDARPTPAGCRLECAILKVDERGKRGLFKAYVKTWK